ncbi:MAG: type II toxin-antitoxin system RelE/ParE family toxin [Cytophagales bacterium]|nr:type II toxin-antitoxin system RelE/ParE family toxin [Cytophagales bacterium]
MSSFEVFIGRAAQIDIQEAFDYYEVQAQGVGQKFLDALDSGFEILRINPNFQIQYDDVHCLPLKRFPFMIHYRIEGNYVLVYAVINTNLNPDTAWLTPKGDLEK